MRHRGEGELLSVRRLRCVLNQAHLYGALFHLLGEIKLRAELLRDLRGERDDFDIAAGDVQVRSEEHTSELQSQSNLVCRLLLEKKKITLALIRQIRQLLDHLLTRS